MSSSILDIGRGHDGNGSPLNLIRCDYPPALVGTVTMTARCHQVTLARRIGASDVARVVLHLRTAHTPDRGVRICYAPVCAMATALAMGSSETDLRPAIASSA